MVTAALKLLVSLLPTGAFFGKGDDGPQVFVTDDCTSGRKSLRSVFPKAGLLLCGFHILQVRKIDSSSAVDERHVLVVTPPHLSTSYNLFFLEDACLKSLKRMVVGHFEKGICMCAHVKFRSRFGAIYFFLQISVNIDPTCTNLI